MEINKMSRENFWDASGEVTEEIRDCVVDVANGRNEALSIFDAWYTLICC